MIKRNDAVALSISFAVHALLLLLFSVTTLGASDYEPIGYIEVEFGPLAEGRPVERSLTTQTTDLSEQDQPVVEEEPQPQAAPEEARPVDLPDEVETPAEETVDVPVTETISPEQQTNPRDNDEQEPQPEIRPTPPTTSGAEDGDTGSESGDDGAGTDEEASAPYQIEGLNRTPVTAPPPPYTEKVNALIRVRITVDPRGRVIRQIPLLKGNPSLEQAVLETLREWRFNPLPPNAPQENQTGVVTFRFRLE